MACVWKAVRRTRVVVPRDAEFGKPPGHWRFVGVHVFTAKRFHSKAQGRRRPGRSHRQRRTLGTRPAPSPYAEGVTQRESQSAAPRIGSMRNKALYNKLAFSYSPTTRACRQSLTLITSNYRENEVIPAFSMCWRVTGYTHAVLNSTPFPSPPTLSRWNA